MVNCYVLYFHMKEEHFHKVLFIFQYCSFILFQGEGCAQREVSHLGAGE